MTDPVCPTPESREEKDRLTSTPGDPLPTPEAPGALRAPDAAVRKRIKEVHDRAAKVRVDGKGGDWEGIPSFADPEGDAGGDASRDIVRVALAPRADDLLVLIATAGKPATEDLAFWL